MQLPRNWLESVPRVPVLVLLALVLWGGEYARRGLWEPDEARYAYVAREMRAGDHWFVPHVNGELYPDKPPLMFWLINASSALTGGRINGISARLPSLLGSILSLWVVTRLLGRWHSARAAWRAVPILLTTFLFWQEGSWAQIDALLCGLVLTSTYFLFTSLDSPHRRRCECLAYFFAGLAVLAKGPIGLIVPMGIFASVSLATGDGARLKRSHWLWGPLLAAVMSGLWLFTAWKQGAPAEFFASMFGEKSFGRAVQSTGHARPFHYYMWHFPLELLPWTIFFPAAVAAISDRTTKRRLTAWIGFVLILFSLFVTKRNLYILSAYPGAAMFIAAAWGDMPKLSARWRRVTASIATGLLWLLGIAATVALFVPQLPISRLAVIPAACVLLAGAALMTRLTRRESLSERWLVAFCSVFFLFQISVSAVVLPAMNSLKGPVAAAEAADAALDPGQVVYLYHQQLAIFPLYADRPGREIYTIEELREVLASPEKAAIVFHKSHWEIVAPEVGDQLTVQEFPMGHKTLVLAIYGGRAVPGA